jgi:hypothetical protein
MQGCSELESWSAQLLKRISVLVTRGVSAELFAVAAGRLQPAYHVGKYQKLGMRGADGHGPTNLTCLGILDRL